MRILFMGTPDFAAVSLKTMCGAGYDVTAVVTQCDKPKGRGHKMMHPPVYLCAEELGLPVYQPINLKRENFEEILSAEAPDLIVVAAYGKILPKYVLDAPKYGCINVHASLLPKYRGAAPIQRCIMDGETETGVTTMYMAEGLDTGDMLLKETVPITDEETFGSLHDKLAEAGGRVLLDTLKALESGTLIRIPQDDSLSCYAAMIDKSTALIDWNKSCIEIRNQIRGLDPAPRAMTWLAGKRLKVGSAKIGQPRDGIAGTVISTTGCIRVQCGSGTTLELLSVQPEGKRMMPVSEYIKGNPIPEGTILGN
ncbi:MAG: methionyl-tRNA formyltransferase [Ruminococcaceae bacterium]|nr:methionyl-tRNA formyltransferase [Oscillospiraceae bacterium]